MAKSLIIYTIENLQNFDFFVENGLINNSEYFYIFVILNNITEEIQEIIKKDGPKPDNVLFLNKNVNNYFNAWKLALMSIDIKSYDYFFFINNKIAGPFLSDGNIDWPSQFYSNIKGNFKLIGTKINYSNYTYRDGNYIFPYIPSTFWCTDKAGLEIILSSNILDIEYKPNDEEISNIELKVAILFLESNYEISVISKIDNINYEKFKIYGKIEKLVSDEINPLERIFCKINKNFKNSEYPKEKYLIYFAVFINNKYLQLVKLLLNSIILFGNINFATTKLLCLTTPDLHQELKEIINLQLFNIDFLYIDSVTTVALSSCARLKIYEYPLIDQFEKILYIDTDVLVMSDINQILELELEDKIYAVTEFNPINQNSTFNSQGGYDYFSKYDFKNLEENESYCAGILLFNNSPRIKDFIEDIRKTIEDYVYFEIPISDPWWDQPFIVYKSYKYNMAEYKTLIKYSVNDPKNISDIEGKILAHVWGYPTATQSRFDNKVYLMMKFTEYLIKNKI